MAQTDMPLGMMQMFEAAEKARACMENVDQQVLERIDTEGKAMEAEVKALCESGKRGQAQKTALAFSRDVTSRPAVQEMRKCSEMMRGMIPDMVPFDDLESDLKNRLFATNSKQLC